MLTNSEEERLALALQDALIFPVHPLLATIFGHAYAGTFPANLNDRFTVSRRVVGDCLARARSGDFTLIDALVAHLAPLPIAGLVAQLVERQKDLIADAMSPFLTVELNRGPLINRKRLKELTQRLHVSDSRPVLVVTGGQQSGKTYTKFYLQHAASLAGDVELALVNAEDLLADRTTDAQTFARLLCLEISSQAQGLPAADRIGELAHSILAQCATRPVTTWVVLDKFSHPDIPQGTRDLIHKLAERISLKPKQYRARLILLDYPPEQLAESPDCLFEAEHIPQIDIVDLEAFFQAALAKGAFNKELPKASAAIVAEKVPGLKPLRQVQLEVEQLLEKIRGAA